MPDEEIHVAISTTETLTLPRLEALAHAALLEYDVVVNTSLNGAEEATIHFTVMDEHARSFWRERERVWASPHYPHYPDIPTEETDE